MKNLKIFLIILPIFLVLILSIMLLKNESKENIVVEDDIKVKNSNLAIMLEKEAGSGKYEESDSNLWPKENYIFNAKLSKCTNGSKLKYNDGTVNVTTNKTDKCYLYFNYDALGSICHGENMAECMTQNSHKDTNLFYHNGTIKSGDTIMDAEDLSYRYAGAKDVVNNYVCLDKKENGTCADSDLYRIIGYFKNENDKYEIKLMKYAIVSSSSLDPTADYYERFSWNNTLGNNKDINMWHASNLNKVKLNVNYYNDLITRVPYLKQIIIDHKWNTGGVTNSNENAKNIYEMELGKNKVKVNDKHCFKENDLTNAIPCTEDDLIYENKIGLMYISDYLYSTLPENWTEKRSSYNNVANSSWILLKDYEWSMTRIYDNSNYVYVIYYQGNTGLNTIYNQANYVRPAFYLSQNTKLKSGIGTQTNPYRISL